MLTDEMLLTSIVVAAVAASDESLPKQQRVTRLADYAALLSGAADRGYDLGDIAERISMEIHKGKWVRVRDEARAKELEKLFQNGGPRTYVQQGLRLLPDHRGANAALRYATIGENVYSRRRCADGYRWHQITA